MGAAVVGLPGVGGLLLHKRKLSRLLVDKQVDEGKMRDKVFM